MSEVQRYRIGARPFTMSEFDEGEWVEYDDYAALQAQLQKQSTLMDMGFAEYERRLATALVENDELKAKLAKAVDALHSIDVYGSDTLSGRTDGLSDAKWYRDCVVEMCNRARTALAELKGQNDEAF